jgi:16S rRNA (guanine(966)-N(2))-methyltransferase RsmD
MRIISGKFRSRAVKAPKSQNIRPTSDKVKGALFNMLGNLSDCSVVDFYSGTGNLAIEAISRGAAPVVLVEKAPESLKLIEENLQAFGLNSRDFKSPVQVLAQDVSKAFYFLHQGGKKFDILLADPPYEKGALKRLQSLLVEYPILKEGGIFAVEHGADDTDLVADFPYPMVRQKKYGDTYLTLFRYFLPGEQPTPEGETYEEE